MNLAFFDDPPKPKRVTARRVLTMPWDLTRTFASWMLGWQADDSGSQGYIAMKRKRFKAEVLVGHKGCAVEVPFNPEEQWAIEPRQLWKGRHGHSVQADLNGARFETFIVPRSKKFFMLVNNELLEAAGVSIGDTVSITVEPATRS